MTEGKFIITTIFYMIVAAMIAFMLGPDIINGGKDIDANAFVFDKLDGIELNYHKVSKNYLNLKIEKDTMVFSMQFYTPENDQESLITLLQENGLIKNVDNYEDEIPKKFVRSDLIFVKSAKLILKDKNNPNSGIQFFSINDQKIKGHNVRLRKVCIVGLGYLLTALGIIGLIIVPISVYFQIKDYREHTIKPSGIPNRYQGIQHFFNGLSNFFKSNKKDNSK